MKTNSRLFFIPYLFAGISLLGMTSCSKDPQPEPAPQYHIGQTYGGGIIFYIDASRQHGLISATRDQSSGAAWGCYGTAVPGVTTSNNIGTGQSNTRAIVNGCSQAGTAARICDDLVLNGYDDWFLPSHYELKEMLYQHIEIGGFSIANYWSSSEFNASDATSIYFGLGNSYSASYVSKNDLKYVRAVRAF